MDEIDSIGLIDGAFEISYGEARGDLNKRDNDAHARNAVALDGFRRIDAGPMDDQTWSRPARGCRNGDLDRQSQPRSDAKVLGHTLVAQQRILAAS